MANHQAGNQTSEPPQPPESPLPRVVDMSLSVSTGQLAGLKLEGFRAGLSKTKGRFVRLWQSLVSQRNRGGRMALHHRILDRAQDQYVETVTMQDTGEVVHHCTEPLSQHQGHGSARTNTKEDRGRHQRDEGTADK
jgi:hypothetical protein